MFSSQINNTGSNGIGNTPIDVFSRVNDLNRQLNSDVSPTQQIGETPLAYGFFEQTGDSTSLLSFKEFANMKNYYKKATAMHCNPTAIRLNGSLNRYLGKPEGYTATRGEYVNELKAMGVSTDTTITFCNAVLAYSNNVSPSDPMNSIISAKI